MFSMLAEGYGLAAVFWLGFGAATVLLSLGWLLLALLRRGERRIADDRAREQATALATARDELQETRAGRDALLTERQRLTTQLARLAERAQRLLQVEQRAAGLEAELARRDREAAVLGARLEEQRRALEARAGLLEQTRAKLAEQFELVANRLFDAKQAHFREDSLQRMGALLEPLRDQLGRFEQQVASAQREDTRARSALQQELGHLRELNRQLGEDAEELARALTGDSKARGSWGELALQRLLEASGLQEGREYELEVSLRDESGRLLRPDAVIQLPHDRQVVVDSKVALNHYLAYCSAEDEDAREAAMRRHLGALREHLRDLGKKRYERLPGLNALDVLLMFVPVEAAFVDAVRADAELFENALAEGIVLVCPSTLLATLKTVAMLWRMEQRNRNAEEIARQAGNLYDKFVGFAEVLVQMGTQIDRLRESHRLALNRLREGHGNLVGRVERLRTLGADTSRSMPRALESDGDADGGEAS